MATTCANIPAANIVETPSHHRHRQSSGIAHATSHTTSDERTRPPTSYPTSVHTSNGIVHSLSTTTSTSTTAPVAIPGAVGVGEGEAAAQGQHQVSAPSFTTLNSSSASAVISPLAPGSFNTGSNNNTGIACNSGAASYNDELSFHTTSYGTSYDSSFSSNASPWAQAASFPPNPYGQIAPPYQIIYQPYPRGKDMEPILEPGELPVPRPPVSYAALIGEALLMAPPPHQLYVSEISDSIKKRYAC